VGYRVSWNRLTEAERQRRTRIGTAAWSKRNAEFRAQLAEIEAANTEAEQRARNRDLVEDITKL
jgi:hypothetical protein